MINLYLIILSCNTINKSLKYTDHNQYILEQVQGAINQIAQQGKKTTA